MNAVLSSVLAVFLLPASGIYNAVVTHNMNQDVPALYGEQAPLKKFAKPIVLQEDRSKAVMMVHGFSGSPADFGKLPKLFEAQGYDVIVPLLPGHGRGPRGFHGVTAQDWKETVFKVYREIREQYEEVILIGLSMGASLSVLTSVNENHRPPDKLILLSPFFKVKQEWYYVLPVETYYEIFSPQIPYLQSFQGQVAVCGESADAKRFAGRRYLATRAAGEAFKIARETRKEISKFQSLQIPMLIMQSKSDKVTDYETTRETVEKIDSRMVRFVTLSRANHVLPRDCEAPVVEQTIMDFAA